MSKLVIILIVLVLVGVYIKFFHKSPRDRMIDEEIAKIFSIKKRHHDLIVKALEEGASDTDHIALLEDKRQEVLAAMEEAEVVFGIEIDKTSPTEVGPVVVIKR